jgi:hypothetical protein
VTDLRTALAAVYVAKAMTPPTFTGVISTGSVILAIHIAELRSAITAVE